MNKLYLVLLLQSVNYVSSIQTYLSINDRPIIGILAQEIYPKEEGQKPNNSYIAASYVKFVESAGARVVPILINQNESYIRDIFSKVNGVLYTGGTIYFPSSQGTGGYVDTGRMLFDLAKEANDKGDFFPIWGTCLGFELLIYMEAGDRQIVADCGAYNVLDRLKWTKETSKSALYGSAPKSIVHSLGSEPLAANFHRFCATPENFTKYGLDKKFKTLSVNYDCDSSLTYISSMEHRHYPFYGVQFHPEKNLFEWSESERIPHSGDAVRVAQYFANFFVDQTRKNGHRFPSLEEETKALIYNFQPVFTGANGSTFVQKYYFPLTK